MLKKSWVRLALLAFGGSLALILAIYWAVFIRLPVGSSSCDTSKFTNTHPGAYKNRLTGQVKYYAIKEGCHPAGYKRAPEIDSGIIWD